MKGVIEKVLMLIWILLPVLIIVTWHGPNLITLMEGGAKIEAQFSAMDIAGAISMLQAGPDGVEHKYSLPNLDISECVKIYPTHVETFFRSGRTGSSMLVEREYFSADVDISGRYIAADCNAEGKEMKLRKESGKIKVTIE